MSHTPIRWWLAGILFFGLMVLAACDRPFVDPEGPGIEVLAPDLSVVQLDPAITLIVETSSVRTVDTVAVNGVPMAFDARDQAWERSVPLDEGLNALVVTAADAEGLVSSDTLHAVRLPYVTSFRGAPDLPGPRGGHAATTLLDGDLLVTGGAAAPGGDATDTAYLLHAGSSTFTTEPGNMVFPRTGHTATLLPDGRVAILGGSRVDAFSDPGELVAAPEIYDPETTSFTPLQYRGDPIQRALHTADVRATVDGFVIDLYGGRGVYPGSTEPLVRGDFRSFLLRGDSLIALNRAPGPLFPEDLAGHTQTPLGSASPGEPARYLVAGSTFSGAAVHNVAFVADFTNASAIQFTGVAHMHTPRTRHAAVRLAEGVIWVFGGRDGAQATALSDPELYVAGVNTFFRFPPDETLLRRYGHTATYWTGNRILILGGFSVAGNAVQTSEFFQSDAF